jgi:Tetratricopeptide repeat
MVDERGAPISGSVSDGEILAHLERHSQAVMRDLYRGSELCSACHKASLPPQLNHYKWIRSFTPYDEWQDSSFSYQSPLVFYPTAHKNCQDCHMPRQKIRGSDYGSKNGTLTSHRWSAGNTAVPFLYGYKDQLEETISFLQKKRYLDVDLFALRPANGGSHLIPVGSGPIRLVPGEEVQAYVVIQNRGIGHSFIPELRDLYQAWVHFCVTDDAGRKIYESGVLRSDGSLDPEAHSFVSRPIDASGNLVDDHTVWHERSEGYDNTIQAGRAVLVKYEFRIPVHFEGKLRITAAVDYRHFRQDFLNKALGPGHSEYPVVRLASQSKVFQMGVNLPETRLPTENLLWTRWNNFGIAALDQGHFEDAFNAFSEVLHLRSLYADAYTNLALTRIEAGKPAEARPFLEKALDIHPKDARALYYLSVVEENEHHLVEAIADLKQVTSQFPGCRAARRALGVAYLQAGRLDEAVGEFRAVQEIDPEDLDAHRYLAQLYGRLGKRSEAIEEQNRYESERPDPAAPSYSQEFLRKHPEILTELVPGHIHRMAAIEPAQ